MPRTANKNQNQNQGAKTGGFRSMGGKKEKEFIPNKKWKQFNRWNNTRISNKY